MSQITVENIKRSTETASRSTRGVAAAWVNLNGTGTVAVRDSENVSGLIDNGVGNYSINFTNSFDAADYAKSGLVSSDGVAMTVVSENATTYTLVNTCSVLARISTTGAARDPVINNFIFHGDLA